MNTAGTREDKHMDEITLYLLAYDTGACDARKALPFTCDQGEPRQYREGYAAGYADVRS